MMSIKRILIPVDLSEASRTAMASGLSVAQQFQARALIVHVVTPPSILSSRVGHELDTEDQAACDAARQRICDLIPPEYRVKGRVESLASIGDVDTELLRIVNENAIDLVVMGTHGRRTPTRWFMGSVTERMLRKLPVPVMTLYHLGPHPLTFKRILYGTDLSEDSAAGFRLAAEFASVNKARLKVIHVVPEPHVLWSDAASDYFRGKYLKSARAQLKALIGHTGAAGTQIESEVIEGVPFREITNMTRSENGDLIVINLQSKTAVERAFLGSTAERVVRLADVPVLGIPLAKPAEGEAPAEARAVV